MSRPTKKYDFKKAKQIIEDRKESIESAYMGMHEDWFWTANLVFERGEFVVDMDDPELEIGGISGSFWATPTLQLTFKDGTDEMIECSTGEQAISFGEKIEQQIMWTSGCLSGPVQSNITDLKTD